MNEGIINMNKGNSYSRINNHYINWYKILILVVLCMTVGYVIGGLTN